MNHNKYKRVVPILAILVAILIVAMITTPAISSKYDALNGVNSIKAVFDVSLASPQMANIVFWAVKNVYDDESVRSLPERPRVAVVFHGAAVKLISTNHVGFNESDKEALNEFVNMIRQMKKDGVKIEVCDYAIKVMGVDPASILPEVDHVGNGFISVLGYQAQGYSLVTID
jgi:intracellular sulfur oxidation DsrE/DsrF family protein